MNNVVSLEYLDDYNIEDVLKAVENGFYSLGVLGKFKSGMKVLIKPCLVEAVSKDNAETTHPAVVRALIDVLNKVGVQCIVADSPNSRNTLNHINEVYFKTGMLEMANLTKCELNQNLRVSEMEVPFGVKTKSLTFLEVINQVDAVINVGKLKFDENLGYLGAATNLFGLIPAEMKTLILNRFSTLSDFNDYIIDINEAFKNKIMLNVLDGVVSLEGNRTPRLLNCLLMSESAYAIDAVVCDILDMEYQNTILKQAQNRDLFDFNKPYKIVGDKIDKFKIEDFSKVEFDNLTAIRKPINYFKSHQQRAEINKNKCKGCSICSKVCPANAIIMKYDKNGELYAEINYAKCVYCKKCVAACPYSIVNVKTPVGYKALMREIQKYNKE